MKVLTNGSGVLANNTSVVFIPTRYDSALFIDSDNDTVTIPDSTANRFAVSNNFCISAFINPVEVGSTVSRFVILSKRNLGASNAGYELFIFKTTDVSYTVSFIVWDTAGRINQISYILPYDIRNKWLHIVINKFNASPASSVSASEWEMFINAVQVTTTVVNNALLTSSITRTTQIITISNISSNSVYSKQYIARLLFFARKLTQSEIILLYNSDGKQKPLDGIVTSKTGTITTPNVGFFTLSGSGTSFLSELSVGMCIFSSTNIPLGFIGSITNNTTAIMAAGSESAYLGTYKAGYLIGEYDFLVHSGTSLADTSIVANNGTLNNFANTSLGVSNQWKNGNTLTPWLV